VQRQYDLQGRLNTLLLDGATLTDVTYDLNGNVTNRTDADQQRTFGYDVLDRLDTDNRVSGLAGSNWAYQYDANGNRTDTDQDGSASTLSYTPNSNRLTNLAADSVIMDAAGNITTLPRGGNSLTLSYNQQNHVSSITNNGVVTQYTTNHQRQRLTKQSNGATSEYVYDLTGRLIATLDQDGKVYEEYVYANQSDLSPIHHRLYADTDANTTEAQQALTKSQATITNPVDGGGICSGFENTASSRLNSNALMFDNGSPSDLLIHGMPIETFTQDIAWLVPVIFILLDPARDTPLTYILGNTPTVIDNAEAVFEWSPITGATEYVIDVATSERSLNNGPDIARHCLTSSETSVQINHIPLNGTNLTVRLWSKANGVWSYQDYHYETESREDAKHHIERTYLIADHLSTPRFGYDDNQTLTWRWASDGFGNQTPDEDLDADGYQTTINIRFPGQYYDSESGLFYNWNRYYDGETGRYVTSDPIGMAGGVNTYSYAFENPLYWTDPKGLSSAVLTTPKPIIGTPSPATAVLGAGMAGYWAGGKVYSAFSGPISNMVDSVCGTWDEVDQVLKPAIPDVLPNDFCEQMALAAAKAGAGTVEMTGLADEPRLIALYGPGPWVKKRYTHYCPSGRKLTIHYFSNGFLNVELKFVNYGGGVHGGLPGITG
jgi:RHS repeat-associated protein